MKKLSFLFSIFSLGFMFGQVGTTCQSPIVISSLPYTTTDNTANYADNYDPDTDNNPACSGSADEFGNYYHGGNDVIYSYTPTTSGTIKIEIPASAAIGWTGMFVYTSCNDIGLNYAACEANVNDGDAITIDNFSVTAGQTYYILISSWPSPQTVSYTLNVTTLTLSVHDKELLKQQTNIYPNPVGKELGFKSPKDIVSANIYTMEGKKIKSYTVHDNMISVDHLSTGSYIVEFTDKAGNTSTKIFIKK